MASLRGGSPPGRGESGPRASPPEEAKPLGAGGGDKVGTRMLSVGAARSVKMAERLTPEEIDALIRAIIPAMKERTARYLCAIYGAFDKDIGELVGSSTLVSLLGETFLLTAEHVVTAKLQPKYMGIAHTTRDGASPRMITTPIYCVKHPSDLALIPVDATELDPVPLGVEGLATTSELVDRDVLFIQGFPGARSRSLAAVYSNTLPYVTGPGKSSYAWFDPKLHFAIDYAARGLIDERGNDADMVDPHGLSGSAVWATGRCAAGDSWEPSLARIVGVIHSWDERSQSLVGTRIEAVRDFVLRALRSRHAFSAWERRGRPAGDDWSDWFSAVQAIPRL